MNHIRKVHSLIEEIDSLLTSPRTWEKEFYSTLNETTQLAYIAMNQGIFENPSLRRECIVHRDFLFSLIPILDISPEIFPLQDHSRFFNTFHAKIKEILDHISRALSSL